MTGVIQTPFDSDFEIILKKPIDQYLQIASVNTVCLPMVLDTNVSLAPKTWGIFRRQAHNTGQFAVFLYSPYISLVGGMHGS